MTQELSELEMDSSGAYGVNYALRPHKFVDRRVFTEIITRFSSYKRVNEHVYVGLGSYAMEDFKLAHSLFGFRFLMSLEIDEDVYRRQLYNLPHSSIRPTINSTQKFVESRQKIFKDNSFGEDAKAVIWLDMTADEPIYVTLNNFEKMLKDAQDDDLIRITVDVDKKVLGRRKERENKEYLAQRRLERLRELLGDKLKPGTNVKHVQSEIEIAKIVAYAFKVSAGNALERDKARTFEPLSVTTYADGHRMLSVTGALIPKGNVSDLRTRMNIASLCGGSRNWDELIDIRIPQLTVWEKLNLDHSVGKKTVEEMAKEFDYKLHESIPTNELLDGYVKFHRFYPTFRHVVI